MNPSAQHAAQSTALDATPEPVALPPRGLFITGTDTGVGKTFVAAAIAEALRRSGLRVGVYKPVATGVEAQRSADTPSDAELLWHACGRIVPLSDVCPQQFAAPAAPPVAAAAEGKSVDPHLLFRGALRWHGKCDVLIVEGVGGLLAPLTEHLSVADLAAKIAYPLVVVARFNLGTLNHTLLTLEVARHRGLRTGGVVLNAPEPIGATLAEQTNAHELRRRISCPLLLQLPHLPRRSLEECDLESAWRRHTPQCDHKTLSAIDLIATLDWGQAGDGVLGRREETTVHFPHFMQAARPGHRSCQIKA